MLSLCAGGLTPLQRTHSGVSFLRHSTSSLKYHSHFWEADSLAASTAIPAFHTAPKLITACKQPANVPSLMSIECSPLVRMLFPYDVFNRLTPNDPYMGRTAPLTSKRCILYIYSTNIGTEYFKGALYSPFFFSSKCRLFHNSNLFGSRIIHIF